MSRFDTLIFLLCLFFWGVNAHSTPLDKAEVSAKTPLYFEADDYRTNFDTQLTTGRGNVKVKFEQRQLNADYAELDNKNQKMIASGNILYKAGPLTATGEKMEVDLLTGFGTFYNGTIRVENGVYIEGQKLEHYAEDRFRVIYGKVSTCLDCPQAWSLTGASIDVEIEGYAEAHHALFQIKDMPVAYFPVFYFPVKQKRQSGFLIPEVSKEPDLGYSYGQSYFWALSPSTDSTFDFRYMTTGGFKGGAEYRNQFSERTFFEGKISGVKNQSLEGVPDKRFGFKYGQRWQLTPNWTQRAYGEFARDPEYTQQFGDDFKNGTMSSLSNEVSLSWQNSNAHFYILNRYTQNNLAFAEPTPREWERIGDIHQVPKASLGIPSYSLLDPFRSSVTTSIENFYRPGPSVDPTTGWIREGQRGTIQARLSSPMGLDYFKWEPSAEVRLDGYNFVQSQNKPQAGRIRTYFDQSLEMDIWKVFDTGPGKIQAIRQSYNPFVRWTYAPNEIRSDHEFFNNDESPKFDLFDPNAQISAPSLGTVREEQRLREHHLVTLGSQFRLIARRGSDNQKSYTRLFTFSIDRDYDIENKVWSRINLSAVATYDGWTIKSTAFIDHKTKRTDTKNSLRYRVSHFETNLLYRSTSKTQIYGGSVALKNIGPWSLKAGTTYDSLLKKKSSEFYGLAYISPSKCWKFSLDLDRDLRSEKMRIRPLFNLTFTEGVNPDEL